MKHLFMATLGLLILGSPNSEAKSNKSKDKIVINWAINHVPEKYFLSAVESMNKALAKETNGRMSVNPIMANSYEESAKVVGTAATMASVQYGTVQMAQVYLSDLTQIAPELNAFQAPFQFEDYAHVERVVESKSALAALEGLKKGNLVGLGYTFSGGQLIVPSTKQKITRWEDFKGLNYFPAGDAVNLYTLERLNANVKMSLCPAGNCQTIADMLNSGHLDTMDAIAQDLENELKGALKKIKYINLTRHWTLLTGLVVNKEFFESLSQQDQKAFRKAAIVAARVERLHIVKDDKAAIDFLKKQGKEIVVMSKKEKQRFRDHLKPIIDKYHNMGSKEILSIIESTRDKSSKVATNN